MKRIPADMVPGTVYESKNFGRFKVLSYKGSRDVEIEFLETGFRTSTTAQKVKMGKVKDKLSRHLYGVGFIGDGEFSSMVSGKRCPAYTVWRNMIARCYSSDLKEKLPTYEGCYVCDEWHNFQNFARWFFNNLPGHDEKYHVDKDIKIEGNRVYSPDTCLVVTAKENAIKAKAKRYKFTSPGGEVVEVYNLASFCRENNLHSSALLRVMKGSLNHHKRWTKA